MKKGFTLVETLVAITVMLLVIIGPMTVAQKGIQTAYFATERATAVFLAQEAIEAVREMRDNQALEVFASGNGDTSDWVIERQGTKEKLFYDSELKKYILEDDIRSGGQHVVESPYSRAVTITESPGDPGIATVEVVVSWESYVFSGDTDRDVTLRTWVYDHYSRYE